MAIAGFSVLSLEGIDLTATYTGYNQASAQSSTNNPDYPGPNGPFTLGQVTKGTDESEWIYVLAGSALAIGDVAILTNTGALWTATAITSTLALGKTGNFVASCPLVAIASGAYGWVQRAGKTAAINVLTAATANTAMKTTSTAGRLTTVITTGSSVNISAMVLTSSPTTTGTMAGLLNYPVVGASD